MTAGSPAASLNASPVTTCDKLTAKSNNNQVIIVLKYSPSLLLPVPPPPVELRY